jgi:hypothetical protein
MAMRTPFPRASTAYLARSSYVMGLMHTSGNPNAQCCLQSKRRIKPNRLPRNQSVREAQDFTE